MDIPIAARAMTRMFSNLSCSELEDLIEISNGFRAARPADHAISYKANAVVPREPWRKLEPGELSTAFELSQEWEPHKSIAILRHSAALLSLFDREQPAIIRSGFQVVAQSVVETIAKECDIAPDYTFCGVTVNESGMPTVSMNKREGKLVGLHVDSWDNLPLYQRRGAKNRLSINIGPSTRHVLFAPINLEDMRLKLNQERAIAVDLPMLPMVFMREFADFPVVRCRLEPGLSYIIPTECMLHDGSSADQTINTRQFVIRGYIRPRHN